MLAGSLGVGVVCAQTDVAQPALKIASVASGTSGSGDLVLKPILDMRVRPKVYPVPDVRGRPLLLQVAQLSPGLATESDVVIDARLPRSILLAAVSRVEPADSAVVGARIGLNELVGLAIEAHPEVASKRADLDAARANQDTAHWQYFPTPSLQVRQDKTGNLATAAVQQPLWSGGRLDAGLDAAVSRTRSADVAISETQYSLALRVTGAWQSWKQARGRAEVLSRGISLLGVYAESVRQRIKGGVSPEVDRELVESRIAQIRGDLTAAQAAERSALSQLSQLIGRPLRTGDLFAGNAPDGKPPVFEMLIEQSVNRSAAIRRIESEIEAARHDTTQKRAALWPTIGVRAEYQRDQLSNVGHVSNDGRVMLVVDFVPGAGLSAGSGIDAAEARVANLRESREAARRELITKVAADYEDHLSSLGRKRDILRTVKASTEVLASYDRLFVAGKRNWLDVLNAARELTQVETSLADVEAMIAASYYRLRLHGNELPWQQQGDVS